MKILFNKISNSMILNEENHKILGEKRDLDISPGMMISDGSEVKIEKNSYIAIRPSPSVLRSVAKRGAQIIDPRDAAVMIMYADMRPDSSVLESGTGSGALTSMIVQNLSEKGSYLGIDHNLESIEITRKNVNLFTGKDVDIIHQKFEDFDGMGKTFDCVFLDLPEPWLNIANQKKYLIPGGRVVTYLPNFDQVEKTVLEYEKNGFLHLETDEIIKREILVRENATRPSSTGLMHTAFISCFIKKSGAQYSLK
ncbi:tRNA (adenine-N1)-methyltransferase [Cuniculiplasma sp. SKW3]|uniref:tRNA (adenine-N1)-methyltransferase n=1 Tax=Cuniculiplasma sp. SKW3 TaxID=3400170 RepID=UPI003FD60B29